MGQPGPARLPGCQGTLSRLPRSTLACQRRNSDFAQAPCAQREPGASEQMGEHLGERQQRAGAGPACPRCSHHLHRHGGQRQLVRSRARARSAVHTCASIYRRAAQREGRRRRTGDAGKRRAGEGCGSVPAPQQHGCRRSSRAQGLDARPVPPSRPLDNTNERSDTDEQSRCI